MLVDVSFQKNFRGECKQAVVFLSSNNNFMSIIIDSNHVALDITWRKQCKKFLPEAAMQ